MSITGTSVPLVLPSGSAVVWLVAYVSSLFNTTWLALSTAPNTVYVPGGWSNPGLAVMLKYHCRLFVSLPLFAIAIVPFRFRFVPSLLIGPCEVAMLYVVSF